MILAAANGSGFVPALAINGLSTTSRWRLIVGIAAMGKRTSFKEVLSIGFVKRSHSWGALHEVTLRTGAIHN
jgi:uncharacterized membrane protein YadS